MPAPDRLPEHEGEDVIERCGDQDEQEVAEAEHHHDPALADRRRPVVALALIPAGIGLSLGRKSAHRFVERTLLACLALAGLGVLFALVVQHDVARTAAFFLPVWGLSWAGVRFAAPRTEAPKSAN